MWLSLRSEHDKIPPMTTYELMVVASGSVDLTSENAQKDLIAKLVGDKAKINEVTSLGKKTLAYPIRKQTEATYLVAVLEGTVKSAELENKAKLMDEVLRLLLTAKE